MVNALAPTISALMRTLGKERDLTLRSGQFSKTRGLPHGANWLGLYSCETEPVYRYAFALWWGEQQGKTAAWVLLNPATGDTDGKSRPILTACRHRSSSWGCTSLVVVNLFAYRNRDPKQLAEGSAVGEHNNRALEVITGASGLTVAAWGAGGGKWQRSMSVRPWLDNPQCLPKNGTVTTLNGEPFYPKGIRLDTELVPLPEPPVPVR